MRIHGNGRGSVVHHIASQIGGKAGDVREPAREIGPNSHRACRIANGSRQVDQCKVGLCLIQRNEPSGIVYREIMKGGSCLVSEWLDVAIFRGDDDDCACGSDTCLPDDMGGGQHLVGCDQHA